VNKKLNFAIDNAKLIDENQDSSFAILSLDFFASGKNKHDTWVSDETLEKRAETIYNRPIVWIYDKRLDDAGTHDANEVPCGFIPNGANIERKKLPDGRTMLSVLSFVWKKYSGRLLEFFMRDGEKPVSVEMSVLDSAEMDDGLLELKDFVFEAVTVLGTFVTPAIPNAVASVFRYAEEKQEYQMAFSKEFSSKYDELDMTIPASVKKMAESALEKHKSGKEKGATSVALAVARHLAKGEKASHEKIRQMAKFFKRKSDAEDINAELHGGKDGAKWAVELSGKLEEIDSRRLAYYAEGDEMPYKSIGEINPALKGIEPPVSLAQANAITKQADAVGSNKEKNGWAIAISSFKKSHVVKDGKWEKKEQMAEDLENIETKEMGMAKEEKKEEKPVPEEKETPEEEKKETPAEEKKEEEKGEEKKFSLEAYLDVPALMGFLVAETEDREEIAEKYRMAAEEVGKGEFADTGKVMSAMFAKMCRMSEKLSKMAEDSKVYMAENEELKKFKLAVEEKEKEFAVEKTLQELAQKVVVPDEAMAEMKEKAKEFALADLDAWKNLCKAKSFDFAVKQPAEKQEFTRMANAWTKAPVVTDSLWVGKK
jgi:hypothetical protein